MSVISFHPDKPSRPLNFSLRPRVEIPKPLPDGAPQAVLSHHGDSKKHPVAEEAWKKPWEKFLALPGQNIRLSDYDPDDTGGLPLSRKQIKERLAWLLGKIDEMQERLYAEGKQRLLIVLQGMDTGGKDGVIRHVIRGMSPQGVAVTSFKAPTPEELSHDFLWRIQNKLPAVGQVGVFNRSHYEDVVAARVGNLVPENVWRSRYETIRNFEANLIHPADGSPPAKIVKIFLHISMFEQWDRLKERLAEKPWKLSNTDFLDLSSWKNYTKKWNIYQGAWQDAINETNTADAPWYIVPANDKDVRDLMCAEIIYKAFKEMNIGDPVPKVDVAALRKKVARMDKLKPSA